MNKYFKADNGQFSDHEYRAFSEFLKLACGIDLGTNKQYLVATRLRRILQEHQLEGLGSLIVAMQDERGTALQQQVMDAMTTNETFWFRDNAPFDYLAKMLPDMQPARPGGKVRIWSAACSSGQEPYSISMVVEERQRGRFGQPLPEVEILATDLSNRVLDAARYGRYDRLSVARGLSPERAKKFFVLETPDSWCVCPAVRQRIRFRSFNLQDSYYALGKFDVIFCRNVLIYFSTDLKRDILTRLHAALNPNGLLFLGSSESISDLGHLYDMVNCNPGVAYRAKPFNRFA